MKNSSVNLVELSITHKKKTNKKLKLELKNSKQIVFFLHNLFCSFSRSFVVLPGGTAVVSSPGAAVLSSVVYETKKTNINLKDIKQTNRKATN